MLIDWFTVGAQVLNFLILVWLLKRFLYKPILKAIDARETRIARELADAAKKQADAQADRDALQRKSLAFDQQRGALLGKAVDEAKAERARLSQESMRATDDLLAKQNAAVLADQARLGQEIACLTKDEVFNIARKALADLATVSLEERLVEVFTRRLRSIDADTKAVLSLAFKSSSEPAVLRSLYALPAEQRAAIQNALNETFSAEIRIRFEIARGGICGIEMTVAGQKLAWTIAEYLDALEQKVHALVQVSLAPAVEGAAKAAAPLPATATVVTHTEAA